MSQRLPIQHTEAVRMGDLGPGQRARLTSRLFELWHEYFLGPDQAGFERLHLFDTTWVVTTLGPAGDLAGFGYINQTELEVQGRRFLVLGGGVFNRIEYHASAALSLALFRQVCRIRLAHPLANMVGISVSTNPIIYDTVEQQLAVAAPREGFTPPPEALEIAQAIALRRGMIIDPHDPWVVQFYGRPAQAARIRASRRYARQTASIRAYEARVPRWDEGQALLSWVPLNSTNIGRSMTRLVGLRQRQA